MKVVLSIKPEFAEKIFDGTKKFEFRRAIFKNAVKTVVVYASSPTQKVIGEFDIESIISDDLDTLWQQTREYAGINEDYFYSYFGDKKKGFAIKIKCTRRYKKPLCLRSDFNLHPPQSFLYYDA
ncbi:ASCH domain-containing protein [Polluticoccus soli]|uniref:ASCH domain-containing protein n=1 Tax=Polluticoccus soli TaxID=3034150 RepID=UPI0023E0CD53|nr:ASCH domain-containing protein [Flavipsychrobacter sp. JY13-12]